MNTIEMPNEVFLPFVVEQLYLVEGKTVTLPLRGRSMRPFLEDGRDKALLIAARQKELCVGDAVLAEISAGHYVLHRIIRIEGKQVTLRGDGNLNVEYCNLSDIKAKAIGFYRKGNKNIDKTDGIKWRTYSWVWLRLYPIRRYLLFILHPHVPVRIQSLFK